VKSLDVDQDKAQIKKLGSLPLEMLFKIEFKKDALQKGKFASSFVGDQTGLKKITTWYIAVPNSNALKAKGLPTALDWITSLTMQCLKLNPNFVPDNMVMVLLSKLPSFFEAFAN